MLDLRLAAPQRHETLTIFPLITPAHTEPPYALLADALGAGALTITEVGSGTVPRLLAVNDGAADVLVLDGEQLIGARQNRMTNRTILLPAKSATEIPVSCMEQGRWHFVSDLMTPTSHHSPANVRRHARRAEAAYAAVGMAAPEEALAHAQGAVWSEIADYSATLGVRPGTGALNDLFGDQARRIEEWAASFPAIDGQVGLLAFVGARPIAMDVIGGRALYARLHGRLLRGYIMDALAIDPPRDPGSIADRAAPAPGGSEHPTPDRGPVRRIAPDADAAQRFLDRAPKADRVDTPTVGRGRYRVLAGEVIGGELEDGGRLAHLCVFPAEEDGGQGRRPYDGVEDRETPLPPPSRRRRTR